MTNKRNAVKYCENCGTESQVMDSRERKKGSGIRRRRKCPKCERKWSTIEVLNDDRLSAGQLYSFQANFKQIEYAVARMAGLLAKVWVDRETEE